MNEFFCVIDFETFSETNLKKSGAFEYSAHPSTNVICVAWKIGDRENIRNASTFWSTPLYPKAGFGWEKFLKHIQTFQGTFLAHNAFFEQCIVKNVLKIDIPIRRWRCTASFAAALGLPRKLEEVAKVLQLPVQKDMEGNRLVLKWCKPRKPTKNNPNTRWDSKDELKRIVKYCKSDVDTQTALYLRIPSLSPKEQQIWFVDQEINFRGFNVDRELVLKVLKLIEEETKELNRETFELTQGEINSTTKRDQLLRFLKRRGVELPDLRAGTVKAAIDNGSLEPVSRRLLEIRQAVSKTSTKKYQAFEIRTRYDGKLRGSLMYHAAHHGRWSGAGVQPQNFPRGNIKDTNTACEIIRDYDLEMIRMTYGDPMNVFSSCLRGMITASKGKVLDVADYAAIEARVLFWFARHEKGIEDFNKGVDSYVDLATRIFNKLKEEITKDMRFVGKQAFLGCFGRNTKVLTKNGWKKIINVTLDDLLWDGVEWVKHEGLVFQGEKEIIKAYGVKATPDHLFLTSQGWAEFRDLKENTNYLESALTLVNLNCLDFKSVKGVGLYRFGLAALVREIKNIKWPRRMFSKENQLTVINVLKNKAQKVTRSILNMLQRSQMIFTEQDYLIGFRLKSVGVTIPTQKPLTLTGGEESKFLKNGEKINHLFLNLFKHLKGGITPVWRLTEKTTTKVTNLGTLDLFQKVKTLLIVGPILNLKKKFLNLKKLSKVYDIKNCGPRNRFTVLTNRGPVLVHNCGYGMGWKKFMLTCEMLGQPVSEEIAKAAVDAYRELHWPVPRLWKNIELAAIHAVQFKGKKYTISRTSWWWANDFLWCLLPAGRKIAFYKPQVKNEPTSWGEMKPTLSYWGVEPMSKKWVRRSTFGGKLVENVVSGTARDLMADTILKIEATKKSKIVLSVHDELVGERCSKEKDFNFEKLMATLPKWGAGVPMKVEGWSGERYRK